MIDKLKYTVDSTHEDFIILRDKFEFTYAIHSVDIEMDKPMVTNFRTASDAIIFATDRIQKEMK